MGEREETGRRLNRSGAALGNTDIHGDEPFKPRHHPLELQKHSAPVAGKAKSSAIYRYT